MDAKHGQVSETTTDALRKMLAGVKDQRQEAVILLIALPENCLPEALEYLRYLTGMGKIDNRH
ncbi:MAG TPA: hypothetical protein VK564_04225 [Thermodesulfobacteriota bacterium]|nr:hypothetical protein [Thermodesulfobacteriota bacterium]